MNDTTGVMDNSRNSTNMTNPTHIPQQRRKYVSFGPYIVGSTLGEGEFGKVKLGWTKDVDPNKISKQVAIKLIRRDNIKDNPDKEMKIFREINALKHLKHPNIINLEEILQNSKYIGIVLEYASGGEFYRYIQRKRRLKEPNACRLFAQLISGVNYMHYKGLVHRDLKLENLLLDKNENLVITDFGFVNEFSPQNQLMKTSCGSPCYAAPELVISAHPYEGTRADTWSCGIILFAMLAGYLPWDDDPSNPNGDDISRLYQYITTTSLKFPDYINPLARDLLRKILVSDPRMRYIIEQIRVHEWLSPYHAFLNISPYDWDVAGKLGSTALMSMKNSMMDNKRKIRPRSMVMNTGNISTNRSTFEYSQESQLSASMNKLNILDEDNSEDSSKTPYNENTFNAPKVVHNPPASDIRSSSTSTITSRTRPRPTTLHITINPSLKPVTIDSNSNQLNSEIAPGVHTTHYNRTYSKKSLNQHEPKTRAVINTINEDESQENIKPKSSEPVPQVIVKKQNESEYDHYGKGTTIQQMEMHSRTTSKERQPTISSADVKDDTLLTVSNNTENHNNGTRVSYMGNDSTSTYKASTELPNNNERKRFSFLSIYSSYSSTKSSLQTNEPLKLDATQIRGSMATKGRYKDEVSNSHQSRRTGTNRTDSRNSTIYTTAPSSVPSVGSNNTIPLHLRSKSHKRDAIKNKDISSKRNQRSSIMISSLKSDAKKPTQDDKPNKNKKEVSTARKVIDFFKRKSTLL
ncbi:serine/threonine-protein kinase Kin4p [Monosporozyma servazzii]